MPKLFDALGREAATLKPDGVSAIGAIFARGAGLGKWQDVLSDDGAAADVGMSSDTDELVNRAESADDSPLFDSDVSGERGGVGHDDVVSDEAIVSDVGIGHDEAVTADLRELAALNCAAVDGDVFTDFVVIANFEAGGFSFVR